MNYYPHHIGDYDSHTAHLSWTEDCAYRRLICLYYRTEKPIPLDIKAVCRLLRATSKTEMEAVSTVLDEFFIKTDAGYCNARCDDEIREASKRRENARNNGTKGGRPKEPKGNQEETQPVISGLAGLNPELTHTKAPNPNPNPNSVDKSTDAAASPGEASPDPRKQLFDLGKSLLGAKAGGLISAACSRVGETAVFQVIGEMTARPTADPKAYFVAATTPKGRGFVC